MNIKINIIIFSIHLHTHLPHYDKHHITCFIMTHTFIIYILSIGLKSTPGCYDTLLLTRFTQLPETVNGQLLLLTKDTESFGFSCQLHHHVLWVCFQGRWKYVTDTCYCLITHSSRIHFVISLCVEMFYCDCGEHNKH